MAESVSLPSVFEYLDYRTFLRDHYTASKQLKPQYSFRYFSRRAGLSSSNFLKLVMDGKRNLGAETVAKRCGFSPKDGERKTFLGIYAEHRKKNPDLPRDMLLP